MLSYDEIKKLTKEAYSGCTKSQVKLGLLYYKLETSLTDHSRARFWFAKAGIQGSRQDCREAQFLLAKMLRNGEGGSKDAKSALILLEHIGVSDDYSAQYTLGLMFENGEGGEQDYAQAIKWFAKAACNYKGEDRFEAAFRLAVLCENNCGVESDQLIIDYWLEKAAIAGHPEALRKYRPLSIPADKEKIMVDLEECIEAGLVIRLSSLLYLYQQNPKKAFEYLYKHEEPKIIEEFISHQPYDLPEKDLKSFKECVRPVGDILKAEFHKNRAIADQAINVCLKILEGTEYQSRVKSMTASREVSQFLDRMEIKRKIEKEQSANNLIRKFPGILQYKLGKRYEDSHRYKDGYLIERNHAVAYSWYEKAALLGNVSAQYKAGEFCSIKFGKKRNNSLAYRWYQMAASQGHGPSMFALSKMKQPRDIQVSTSTATSVNTKSQYSKEGEKEVKIHKDQETTSLMPMAISSAQIANSVSKSQDMVRKIAASVSDGIRLTPAKAKTYKTLESSLSPEKVQQLSLLTIRERQTFVDWTLRVSTLEADMLKVQGILGLDVVTRLEQAQIDSDDRLKRYYLRLEADLNRFILCYFLAPTGILQLSSNNLDLVISAIGDIPLIGQFIKILTTTLTTINKKYRLYKIDNLNSLFKDPKEISETVSILARRLTLVKQESIKQQKEAQRRGFEKLQSLYLQVKEAIDCPGIVRLPEERLAILDYTFLLQQVMAGTKIIKPDSSEALADKFIEIITGETYKPVAMSDKLQSKPVLHTGAPVVETGFPDGLTARSSGRSDAERIQKLEQLLTKQCEATAELKKQLDVAFTPSDSGRQAQATVHPHTSRSSVSSTLMQFRKETTEGLRKLARDLEITKERLGIPNEEPLIDAGSRVAQEETHQQFIFSKI